MRKGGEIGTEKEYKSRREEELDRFWDLDALVPKKKANFNPVADTTTAEIEIPAPHGEAAPKTQPIPPENGTIRRFVPPHTEADLIPPEPLEEYAPENGLLRRVSIYRPKSTYQYYEAFLRDAIRLYPIRGEACERVTFFSYVPQYSQMNRSQLEWYLWWRECVRRKEFLQTDYSYILLYLYELINLSERLDPKSILDSMIDIWENYREIYRQLDGYLSEWVCDLCLLHRMTLPTNFSKKLLSVAMAHASLREFYFASEAKSGYTGALIAFCNNYDYHKSKFCTGENESLFDTWIPAVLSNVVELLSEEGKLFAGTRMDDSRMTRNAYTGALCACGIKRNVEVEYCSFSRSNELRYLITDVIKYTENYLRGYLGVRSRLSVYSLPVSIKTHIESFLSRSIPPKRVTPKVKRVEERAEYEKLYDAPARPLSIANAAEIERLSWGTTERLIDAFEREDAEVIPQSQKTVPVPAEVIEPMAELVAKQTEGSFEAFLPYLAFLSAVKNRDFSLQKRIAREQGMLLDALADALNEAAVACTEDILIEDDGDGYVPISDYEELLSSILEAL